MDTKPTRGLRILFVSSGNAGKESIIIANQADSLRKAGLQVELFLIKGAGFWGYLKNIIPLRKHLKKNKYDIVHSHYSFSGFVASLSFAKPLIVSLMGSDIHETKSRKYKISFFRVFFGWDYTIVKSDRMMIRGKKTAIIPNGVDLDKFFPMKKSQCIKKLGWHSSKINVLFAGDPARIVKNFSLTEKAVALFDDEYIELHSLGGVTHEKIPFLINASDIVMLTSLWEGSANVIKEAMACNCPVVSTDVGDVSWLFGEEPRHYLAGFTPEEVAKKVKEAIEFSKNKGRTNGRARLKELGLDEESVSRRIIDVYLKCLKKT
mgnify:CR=1 FL=1